MSEYLIQVVLAVTAGTVAELLPPDAAGGGRRACAPVTALLILCAIVLPAVSWFADGEGLRGRIDDFFDSIASAEAWADESYAEQTAAYLCRAGAEAAEGEIAVLLAERFGFPADCCRTEVTLCTDENGIGVESVRVFLHGRAIFADSYAIEDYLDALFGAKAVVILE